MAKLSINALLALLLLTISYTSPLVFSRTDIDRFEQINYPDGLFLSGRQETKFSNANITITGWIKLIDESRLTFENCIIRLIVDPSIEIAEGEGDVTLIDKAKLYFINSSMLIRKDDKIVVDSPVSTTHYSSDGYFVLGGVSCLIVVNTDLSCSVDLSIHCGQTSELLFDGVTYTGVHASSGLHFGIEDRTLDGLLSEFHNGYSIYGYGESRISIINSKVGRIDYTQNSTLVVEDSSVSYLSEWSTSENVRPRDKAIVKGSSVKLLHLNRENCKIHISNPLDGYHTRWDSGEFYENNPAKPGILFLNSTLENIWLSLGDCESEFINTDLKIASIWKGTTKITNSRIWLLDLLYNAKSTISNSTVSYLSGSSGEDLDLTVSNTQISTLFLSSKKNLEMKMLGSSVNNCIINHRWYTAEKGVLDFTRTEINNLRIAFTFLDLAPSRSLTLKFDDCTLKESLTINEGIANNEEVNIIGSLSFGPKLASSIAGLPNRPINRSYDVIVSKGNMPLKGVTLKLVDAGQTVLEAVTNDKGLAEFNLSFRGSLSNINEIYSKHLITAEYERSKYSVEIGLLSDTPVELKMKTYSNLQAGTLAIIFVAVLLLVSIILLRKTSFF